MRQILQLLHKIKNFTVTGGGKLALGGFTLTVPATGTAALLATSNNFSVTQYINDTSNANMTQGLTINQGGNDDEILALKSSDIAHGMTTLAETDTYGEFYKFSATVGGLVIRAFSETTTGLILYGVHTTDDATKSTAGVGAVRILGQLKSGTTASVLGADANILSVDNSGSTRFILDGDGDSHQDVGTAWTQFDLYDDAQILDALALHVGQPGDLVRSIFGEFLQVNKEKLEELRLVTFNDDGHHFVNMSRLTMLLVGAIRQNAAKVMRIERMLTALSETYSLLQDQEK